MDEQFDNSGSLDDLFTDPSLGDVPSYIGSDIRNLRIKVTSRGYDDIGKVLTSLQIKFTPFNNRLDDCDILFVNCASFYEITNIDEFKQFIIGGGIVYISDLSSDLIDIAFPGVMRFEKSGNPCQLNARILDYDLANRMGNTISVNFDMGAWSKIKQLNRGEIILQDVASNMPLMVYFPEGHGKVYYTSFHNHAQLTSHEEKLLQLLIVKQVSQRVSKPFNSVAKSFGI
jgi:hypothetical protein